MLLEQGEAVDTNMSKIARMKTRAGLVDPGEYAPVATEFNEVFGGEHPTLSWHWFLPLPVRFPEWARENVMGYEWDLTFDPVPYQEPTDTDADTVGSAVSFGRCEKELDISMMGDGIIERGNDVEIGGNSWGFDGHLSSLEQEHHDKEGILPAKLDHLVKKRSSHGSTSNKFT